MDLDEFRRTMREAGVEEAVGRMLEVFLSDGPSRLAELGQAIESGDAQRIERAAHAFKSAAGAIAARRAAEALRAIELAAKAGAVDQARSVFPSARSEIERVLDYLQEALHNRSSDN